MGKHCPRIDEPLLKKIIQDIPDEMVITRISAIFQAIHSETRLKILFLLSKKELCVCELDYMLDVTQSAISHSLRVLRQLDLVRVRKDGKFVIYYIADDHVWTLIELCRKHVMECNP